jgi:hypothetical protein
MQNEITQLALDFFKKEVDSVNLTGSQLSHEEIELQSKAIAEKCIVVAKSFFSIAEKSTKIDESKIGQFEKNKLMIKSIFDWEESVKKYPKGYTVEMIVNYVASMRNEVLTTQEVRFVMRELGFKTVVKRFNGVSKRCYVLPPLAKNKGDKS